MSEKELAKKIIGCAIEVHKQAGTGLLESACQECLYSPFHGHLVNLRQAQCNASGAENAIVKNVKWASLKNDLLNISSKA